MACHNDIILFDLFHMGQIDQIAIVAALEGGVLQLFLDALQAVVDMEGPLCMMKPDGVFFGFNEIDLRDIQFQQTFVVGDGEKCSDRWRNSSLA